MTIDITEPGAFLASLPGLIGYFPRGLAVLAGFDERGSLGPLVIGDVHDATDGDQLARRLIRRVPVSYRVVLIVAVVSDPARGDVVDALQRISAVAGIPVEAALSAAGTRPGESWVCRCGCARTGLVAVPDPELLTFRSARRGAPHRSLEALARTLAPAAADILARRAAMLAAAPDPHRSGPTPRRILDHVLDEFGSAPADLPDHGLVDLVRSLADGPAVISALLTRTGELHGLLEAAVRGTPVPYRAIPTAYFVIAALLQGDGLMARIAAGHALELADEPHSIELARLAADLATASPQPAALRVQLLRMY